MAENPAAPSEAAQSLFVDPTPVYQPALDFIDTQRTQANERYSTNKADIANIFGSLTSVNKESQNRVNEQFTKSIADQQMNLAERTAAARTGMEQTAQSAQAAGMERGGGPAGNFAASPVAVAGERGIADSNAFATIWEGQQRAVNAQTIQNLANAQEGYGFQQVQANQQLQGSLENTLNQLAGQEVGVRQELAQAIVGGQSRVAEAGYNEYLQKQADIAAQNLAATRGRYSVEQAAIDAQNKLDLATINASNRVNSYQANSAGTTQFMRNEGASDKQISEFWASVDSADLSGATNSREAFAAWKNANMTVGTKGRLLSPPSGADQAAARLYFDGLRYDKPEETTSSVDWSKLQNSSSYDPYVAPTAPAQ